MKKLGIILMFFAATAFVSCSALKGAASTTAGSDGSKCAQALVGLYNSKKANGTISITNANDLANMLVVINSYNQLKANQGNETYKSQFTSGLIAGGTPIINTNNATTILNNMISSTGLNNVNASNIAQKAETVGAIITLLNALK